MITVVWIALAVLVGGLGGYFFLPPGSDWIGDVVTGMLCLLVFFAGMDVGHNWTVMRELLRKGHQVIMVPIAVAGGSIVGGFIAALLLGMNSWEVMAVTAAVGWYSLSGPMITELADVNLGTVAFMSNLMREILSFAMIPLVARYVGHLAAIGPGGATTMDSTLPIISRFTSPQNAMIAFFSGFGLTFVPPIVIPFCLKMAGW